MPRTCDDPDCTHITVPGAPGNECWSRRRQRVMRMRTVADEEPGEDAQRVRANIDPAEVLDRTIREVLDGSGNDLPHDLAAAVIDAAREVLIDQDECTVSQLNELFQLRWSDPDWILPLDDLPVAVSQVQQNLYEDWDLLGFLDCTVATSSSDLGSSPGGSATMMSGSGIGLYEFTVDDSVYFFVVADRDVCESQWWFAHNVNDMETREGAGNTSPLCFWEFRAASSVGRFGR